MHNRNELINLCCICGKKRVENVHHRLYNFCNICVAKNSAPYYQANRDKIIARSRLYQENTKRLRKSDTQQIEELNNKVEKLTRDTETLFLNIE